jgi:hypothetical protein
MRSAISVRLSRGSRMSSDWGRLWVAAIQGWGTANRIVPLGREAPRETQRDRVGRDRRRGGVTARLAGRLRASGTDHRRPAVAVSRRDQHRQGRACAAIARTRRALGRRSASSLSCELSTHSSARLPRLLATHVPATTDSANWESDPRTIWPSARRTQPFPEGQRRDVQPAPGAIWRSRRPGPPKPAESASPRSEDSGLTRFPPRTENAMRSE